MILSALVVYLHDCMAEQELWLAVLPSSTRESRTIASSGKDKNLKYGFYWMYIAFAPLYCQKIMSQITVSLHLAEETKTHLLWTLPVSAFCGCYNKLSYTCGSKQHSFWNQFQWTEIKVLAGSYPIQKLWVRPSLLLLPASPGCWHPLTCGCIPPVSASISHLLLCIKSQPAYIFFLKIYLF